MDIHFVLRFHSSFEISSFCDFYACKKVGFFIGMAKWLTATLSNGLTGS